MLLSKEKYKVVQKRSKRYYGLQGHGTLQMMSGSTITNEKGFSVRYIDINPTFKRNRR